jgi:hypothetical protein
VQARAKDIRIKIAAYFIFPLRPKYKADFSLVKTLRRRSGQQKEFGAKQRLCCPLLSFNLMHRLGFIYLSPNYGPSIITMLAFFSGAVGLEQ